jgi:hypothetical protein
VIEDTPVKWDSDLLGHAKADTSLRSCLFSLKNPHNALPRKFALQANRMHEAIYCKASTGPGFGGRNCDIGIADSCNTCAGSVSANFGRSYANNTWMDGRTLFTGSGTFTVKEIEVFEISD